MTFRVKKKNLLKVSNIWTKFESHYMGDILILVTIIMRHTTKKDKISVHELSFPDQNKLSEWS